MSRIRNKDTRPEKIVRSILHRMGLRFRLHQKIEGCTPDIILARHKMVVFVHGCFWHRHPDCKFAYTPKSRVAFWNEKFAQNVARDQKNQTRLANAGWQILIVWECETKDPRQLEARLVRRFTP